MKEGEVATDLGGSATADVASTGDMNWAAGYDDFTPDTGQVSDASVTTDNSAQAGTDNLKPDTTGQEGQAGSIDKPATQDAGAAPGDATKAPEAGATGDAPVDAAAAAAAKAATDGDQAAAPVTAAIVDDSELTAAEKAVVQSLPKAEQPEAVARYRKAAFMDFYLDPAGKPIEEVRAHLESRSPSRYAELERSIESRLLSNPVEYAAGLFTRDKDLYGNLAAAVFAGDKEFFTKAITGREDVAPEAVQTALDFYDRHKDKIADEDLSNLSDEDMEALSEYTPEIADKVKAALQKAAGNGKPDAALQAKLDKLESYEKAEREKAEKGQSEAQLQAEAQKDLLYDEAYDAVEGFVTSKLNDPTDGLGLEVTDKEREVAPDVANLKDIKRHILLKGYDDLPDFENGLGQWGEKQPDFMAIGKALGAFAFAGEKHNVMEKARALNPYADRYLSERVNHPIISWIDKQIAAATQRAGSAPPVETFVPGSSAAPSGQGQQSLDEFVDNFRPQV